MATSSAINKEPVASAAKVDMKFEVIVIPVADVDVVVGYDDELGVHELAQEAPDSEHYAFRMSWILFLHAYASESIRAAFRRQIKIDYLRKLLNQ